MKHTFLLLIFAAFTISAFAQENVVKVGLPNMIYGDFQLGYERVITEGQTMSLKVGYFNPSTTIFDVDDIAAMITDEYTADNMKGGWQTSIDYRFYVNKNEFNGFYVAPYFRYVNTGLRCADTLQGVIAYDVDAKVNMFGIGAQLGFQWIIKEHFSIDFNIFGLGVDYYNPKFKYTRQDKALIDYDSVKKDVEASLSEAKYFAKRAKYENNDNKNLDVKIPLWLPGIRLGLTLGYAF